MSDQVTDKVFVTVGGRDVQLNQTDLGLTMASTEAQILAQVQGVINENLADEEGNFSFTVRRGLDNRNLYVYPKTPAGRC